jgi:hypothetical protein
MNEYLSVEQEERIYRLIEAHTAPDKSIQAWFEYQKNKQDGRPGGAPMEKLANFISTGSVFSSITPATPPRDDSPEIPVI